KQLCWWDEAAERVGLPAHGQVFHMHPIGLVGCFSNTRRIGDLFVERGQITFDAEGNDNPASEYFSRRLHWPGGASGVTLGRGYDMKHRSSATVYSDLIAAGVDAGAAERFSRGAGLSNSAASNFVIENREAFGNITIEAQRKLFEDIIYPRYELAARQRYSIAISGDAGAVPWERLHDLIRDIAVDLTYQQGSIWDRQIPYISKNNKYALARYIRETLELSQYEAGRQRYRYLMEGDRD
ncbi:calcium sensor EFh, partial [Pseudomonas panipatensis]